MQEIIRRSVYLLARFGKLSGVICGLVIPTAVGLFALYYDELVRVSPFAFWLPVGFFAAIAILYSWYTFEMPIAAELYAETTQLTRENENLSSVVRYMSLLQEELLAWNVILRGYVEGGIASPEELSGAVSVICQPIVEERDTFFAFDRRELWNFAVYLWDNEANLLCPVWRERHPRHPSDSMGRQWREGQGHVGHAFSRKDTLITSDASQEGVRDLMAAGGEERDYDAGAYVSYVSQPITRLGEDGRPYGVIVATSDKRGQFDKANALILLHAAAVIASAIELAYNRAPRVEGPA